MYQRVMFSIGFCLEVVIVPIWSRLRTDAKIFN